MKRCHLTILVAAAAGFVVFASTAGAAAASLAGTYTDQNGITQLVFKNDRVTITRLGIMQGIFKYTVDGKEITVSGANSGQGMLLEIDDKGCLVGVPGSGELCKSGPSASAGTPPNTAANTSGVSGAYEGADVNGGRDHFDFHDDGTVELSSSDGVIVTAAYTVVGRKVSVTAPKAAGGEVMVLRIDDKGCLVSSDGSTFCRAAPGTSTSSGASPDTSGVWGVYAATDPSKGSARWVFYNDGKVEMSTQGAKLSATYTVDGKKITVTPPKSTGGDAIVLQTDEKGCLYSPDNPSGARFCKQ